MNRIGFLLIITFLVSCGNGKTFEKRIDKVFGGKIFRGFTIGDSYNTVLNKENKDFMEFPDSNMLKYMYLVSDSEEYHWAYVFKQDKVSEIQFDAYLGGEKDGERYTSLIEKRYSNIWGPSTTKDGIISWNKDGVRGDLINESPKVMMGKVKFFIYADGDSVIKRYVPGL